MADEKEKPIRTETKDGHKIAIYASGMQYDLTAGHLIRPPDRALITPTRGADMAQRGKEIREQAAREAADEAAEDAIAEGKVSIRGDKDHLGLRALVKKNAEMVFDAKSGRSVEGPNNFIARAAGYFSDDKSASAPVFVQQEIMSPEHTKIYLKLLTDLINLKKQEREKVIDVPAQDVPSWLHGDQDQEGREE